MIPLHDKNRISPKCVFVTLPGMLCTSTILCAPIMNPGTNSSSWRPCDVILNVFHHMGLVHAEDPSSVPGAIASQNSGVGIPQGGHPRIKRERPMIVLIKIITKCWYSLIVQNTLLFFIEILHLHKFTWGLFFLKSNSQSTNINLKWNVAITFFLNKNRHEILHFSYVCPKLLWPW